MKILILGSEGMAGHMISNYLSKQGYTINTLARNNADFCVNVENINEITTLVERIRNDYDFIINCIGLLVQQSIERPDRAAIINAWLPHMIENKIQKSKTRFIHLSTDCVFDGTEGNYSEDHVHTEVNAYGKSKSYGEINNTKDITFRMSIIGPEIKKNGTGLMNWITTSEEKTLSGWDNALWNGITTLQLAKCIEQYLKNPIVSGIYHLVNNDVYITKYELLNKINKQYNLGKTIFKSKGPKSVNKILVNNRQDFQFDIPDYDIQLQELHEYKK